jgi:hypothetical protein
VRDRPLAKLRHLLLESALDVVRVLHGADELVGKRSVCPVQGGVTAAYQVGGSGLL